VVEVTVATTRRLQREEYGALLALLADLTDEEWSRPTPCEGWAVRDVVAHLVAWDDLMVVGSRAAYVPRLLGYGAAFAGARMSADRLNDVLLGRMAALDRAALLDRVRPRHGGELRLLERVAPGTQLAEYVVHHEDVRVAVGRPRSIADDTLRCALDGVFRLPGGGARGRARGLALTPTDVSWTKGSGADVRGPARALLLAVAGREAGLEALVGDGVAVLAARLRDRCDVRCNDRPRPVKVSMWRRCGSSPSTTTSTSSRSSSPRPRIRTTSRSSPPERSPARTGWEGLDIAAANVGVDVLVRKPEIESIWPAIRRLRSVPSAPPVSRTRSARAARRSQPSTGRRWRGGPRS